MFDNNPPSSRFALRTLLILIAVLVGLVIYAYGWNTTDISLDEVQDPTRQQSVKRAMTELLSPNIFDRDRTNEEFLTDFKIGCSETEPAQEDTPTEDDTYVVFTPSCAETNEIITVEGFNFHPSAIGGVRVIREDEDQTLTFKIVKNGRVTNEDTFDINSSGHFKVDVQVPRAGWLSRGSDYTVEVRTAWYTGAPRLSGASHEVIDKMIETIFLALMATTLAVPISFVLSFLSARNLMRQVRLPLGPVLVGFVLLPLGAALAYWIVGAIGKAAVEWGRDVLPGIIVMVIVIAVFAAGSALLNLAFGALSQQSTAKGLLNRIRALMMSCLLLFTMIILLGVLGGLGIRLGDELRGRGDVLSSFGQFVGTLGTLVDISIAFLAAVGGAFLFASTGAGISASPLRYVPQPVAYVLGAILGTLSGAILLAFTAYIGMQAVLLGLLTAIVAAILGGQVLVLIYQRLFNINKPRRDTTTSERVMRSMLFVVGAAAAFLIAAYLLDLVRAIFDERTPGRETWDLGLFSIQAYIGKAALMGAVLGGLAGGLSGTHTAFPLGLAVYNTSRTILNALRSIEPLIMGIVFVIWVGVGPFAGVLALTLHSIASLGKLYSEQVESIESGPIEAILSTGANRLQMIIYGVVPQIIPPYIAFTMYRWDINVRMSTIIGFVGGGGIGFLLQQQINLLQYSQAGVAVLAIAIVVSVLDYASAAIREHVV